MHRHALVILTALPLLAGPAFAQDQAATIATADSDEYGTYLTDGEGRSVYMFESDRQGTADQAASSSCGGDCAAAWPPVTVTGEPMVGDGATAEMLGTFDRGDGTMQVTYNGWPLYYYHEDTEPGQTNGHDIKDFGAEWYLLNAKGEEAGEEGEAASDQETDEASGEDASGGETSEDAASGEAASDGEEADY